MHSSWNLSDYSGNCLSNGAESQPSRLECFVANESLCPLLVVDVSHWQCH